MTSSTERIDRLALVWLVVPRKESRVSGLYPQLKGVAPGKDEQKRLATESIARLRERGMIEPGKLLKLTEAGRHQALESLGGSRIQPSRTALQYAKKMLLLRAIGADPTPVVMKKAGAADAIAARIVARSYGLDRKGKVSPSEVLAVLARRALGLEEKPSFGFDEAFSAVCLEGATLAPSDHHGAAKPSQPPSSSVSLKLADRSLSEFASLVTEAARTSVTGRWHGAVFISHVWHTLESRGNVGISFDRFKRRLIEAYQQDLVELSRADLVDAMPAADVSASETIHSGARFHFVRLEQLAS